MSDINITVNDEIVNIDVIDTPVYVEVTNSPGPAGAGVAAGGTTGQVLAKASNTNYDTEWVDVSGGVWGTITGTLINQTDLQNALNAKVPYSGATGDVSLGEYGINVGNVIYDTTPTGIPTEQGATYWDADAETVALIMNGTIQKVGEDTFYHVRNTTGSTIAKGTAVRFSGTTGNSGRLLIAPMLADGTYPSQYYMGITSEELVNNADGKVYHFGKMRNINTSAFADGDVLYVSPSVAGALTATAPVAPNNIIVAAAVVHAANNGTLMIRTTLGSNINADEGVLLTTPSANDGLFYDSGLWVNKSINTALGFTPANAATTLTINGVTYDLSADRTWTIAAGISGSGAAGQVTYWTGTNTVSGSNNLFWDNANNQLRIQSIVDISAINEYSLDFIRFNARTASNGVASLFIPKGTPTGFAYDFEFRKSDSSFAALLIVGGGSSAGSGITNKHAIAVSNEGSRSDRLVFRCAPTNTNWGLANDLITLFPTGNVLIQNASQNPSDFGTRFGVSGDTLLRGSGATSATTALTVQNSDGTNALRIFNNGTSAFRTIAINSTANFSGNRLQLSESQIFFVQNGTIVYDATSGTQANSGGIIIKSANTLNPTINTPIDLVVGSTFAPTSGTGTFVAQSISPTINQTGGANGITRGLYVNPTLTAAVDFRAIETTAGNVLFGSNFFWDNTNGRLGIGTNAPLTPFHVVATDATLLLRNTSSAGYSGINMLDDTNTLTGSFQIGGSGAGATLAGHMFIGARKSGGHLLFVRGSGATVSGGLFSTGNFGFGFTTDPGVRLGVVGDTLLRGSGATFATSALKVQNTNSIDILTVQNGGNVIIGEVNTVATLYISSVGDTRFEKSTSGTNGLQLYGPSSASHTLSILSSNSANYANGALSSLRFNGNYVSSAGSTAFSYMLINGTINQTGTSTSITRGLYVNPTLTAAADFRAIETTAGNVLFGSNFFWNNTNARLGIGIATPAVSLDVRTSAVGELAYFANTAANSGLIIGTQTNVGYISSISSLSALGFGINGATSGIRIFTNSNVAINSAADLGVRFGVIGDTLLRGSGATSGTAALSVQNSSLTQMLLVRNDGKIVLGTGNPPTNSSIHINIPNGYVNFNNSYSSGSFITYQAFGQYDGLGADTGGTILALGGYRASQWLGITLHANGNEVMRIKGNGQVRFVPLASAPASPQSGDVYYDSTLNKLRVYTTAWETITSI